MALKRMGKGLMVAIIPGLVLKAKQCPAGASHAGEFTGGKIRRKAGERV